MVSSFIGNEVPRKGLRVRVPCPPLGMEVDLLNRTGFHVVYMGSRYHTCLGYEQRRFWLSSHDRAPSMQLSRGIM